MPTKNPKGSPIKAAALEFTLHVCTNRNPTGPDDSPTGFGILPNPKGEKELRYAKAVLTGLAPGKPAVKQPTVAALTIYPENLTAASGPLLGSAALLADIEPRLLDARGSAQADLLVYVHGYQTSFAEAMTVSAQTAHNLICAQEEEGDERSLPLVPIAFTWPSDGELSIKAYWSDAEEAAMSGAALYRFLARLSTYTSDRARRAAEMFNGKGAPPRPVRIHLIVQSMGHQVLAGAMRLLAANGGLLLDTVLSTGGDIEKNAFAEGGSLRPLLGVARHVVVYNNPADGPLNLSQTLRLAAPRLGHVGPDDPLPGPGLCSVDVTGVMEGTDTTGHYYGRLNPAVQRDMARVLAGASPEAIKRRRQSGIRRFQLA